MPRNFEESVTFLQIPDEYITGNEMQMNEAF